MSTIRCGVATTSRHTRWSDCTLSAILDAHQTNLDFHRLPSQPAAVPHALEALNPPIDVLLLFATPDTAGWASRVLRVLGKQPFPSLLVTRGFRAEKIEQLLDAGASDFVPHGFDAEELLARIGRLVSARPRWGAPAAPGSACAELQAVPTTDPSPAEVADVSPPPHPALSKLVGRSPELLRQTGLVPTMANCNSSVLILGETGTGKELCAQAIHYMSPRANGPWIAVNCGALPADLVEAELFGHARGAYTSAYQSREGLIAQAEGGTLLLDEVDSLPLPSQAKLLRFLQEKEYRAVGSDEMRRANVRVISATNIDLPTLVTQGTFRRDLYYRLNVLTLKLPALRERRSDILVLAQHFIALYAREFGRAEPQLSRAVQSSLETHQWPGNVRELEHCVERAVLLCQQGEIAAEDLGLPALAEESPFDGSFRAAKARSVEAFERQYLEQALQRSHGNIGQAAAAASKNRRAFFELMRRHNIKAGAHFVKSS